MVPEEPQEETPVVPEEPQEETPTVEDLSNEKVNAKQKLQTYKDLLNFDQMDDQATTILIEANKLIDNATTKEEIDNVVTEAQNKLDELKQLENLQNEISKAIEEISNYKNDYNYTNKEEYNNLLNQIIDNINNSKTIDEVNNNLTNGKQSIDELIENDLNNYKEQAKNEIKNYNISVLYSEENQKLIDNIKNDAINKIVLATNKEEIDNIVKQTKEAIDKIQKLTETKYTVKFIGLNGTLLKNEQVLYNNSASAPEVDNITINGITYQFVNWDNDYSNITSDLTVNANYKIINVKANILIEDDLLSTIDLNINDKILETISNNTSTTLTTNEDEIKNIVNGTLPILDKQNYKYQFNSLNYNEKGFNIIATEVIDEEELNKNTVVVTYTINDDGYVFNNNKNQMVKTETNGKNVVSTLPKVFKNNKEIAVVWKDANDNIISNITQHNVNLNEELIYTESTTLTAYLDDTKPVITLNGNSYSEVELSLTNEYVEEGYDAIDNFDGDITSLVNKKITFNDVLTNQVDYSVAGSYVITYSVTDSNGNSTSISRTIHVIDPITEIKASVFALKDGVERPSNKDRLSSSNYEKIGEVNLAIDKVRKYLNGPITIIDNKNIESYVIGTLPSLNDKYYYYEYYVIKYEKDGFHIDCERMFDIEKYTNDKLQELNNLLNKDYSEYKDSKTTDSYNNLITALENGKTATTLEEIEKAINEINNAINNLVNVELIKLELSSNNDIYYLNDKAKNIEVTAIYNDATKNKKVTNYTVNGVIDTKTVGNKMVTYTYENKQVVYQYTVNYNAKDLNKLIKDIKITLDVTKKCEGKKCDNVYNIKFEKLKNLDVKSIEIMKNNKLIKNINIIKKNNNILNVSKDDYNLLRENNTMFGNKIIRITYTINKQEVSADYYEILGNLNRL